VLFSLAAGQGGMVANGAAENAPPFRAAAFFAPFGGRPLKRGAAAPQSA